MKALFTILFVVVTIFSVYSQDTISVPGDYTTIQAAIYAAGNGDVVLVSEGTYYENIRYFGKAVTVASHFLIDGNTTHIQNTIIDGSQPSHPDSCSVVSFVDGEDTTSVLQGFTLTGGTGTYTASYDDRSGGAIYMFPSGAKICDNIIEYNSISHNGYAYGGGILVDIENNSLIIENNIFKNNSVSGSYVSGGGMSIWNSNYTRVTNNKFIDNSLNGSTIAWGGAINCNSATSEFHIISNYISGNVANSINGGGGGICIYSGSPVVLNNIISNNSAYTGGGIYVELSQESKITDAKRYNGRNLSVDKNKYVGMNSFTSIVNNTIIRNSVTSNTGAGITIFGPPINLINSIVWDNQPTNYQIEGSVFVTFSDVEGEYSGEGNISVDPDFSDTVNFYLNLNSPCIDAGNQESLYNDIEDPLNPGYALWPALGSLRNDMGAYGGHFNTHINTELLGPQFRAFVNRVNSLPVQEKQAIIDSFMNAVQSFPVIEGNNIVYYIYQGAVGSVNVPSDANNWNTNAFPMTKLSGTIFWYREAVFESDARLDYKYFLNGSTWILDPLNPKTVMGGYGPNSELAMPDYVQPPEIEYYPNIPHGTISSFPFTSTILNNTRTIKIYTPFNYESSSNAYYPIMLLHDGQNYLDLGYAINTLDYLIALSKIDPIICIFVPPVDRDNEYGFNKTQEFESFIISELMPYIDSTYRTTLDPNKRGMAGVSLGGLITTQICYNRPEIFGLSAPFSPAYWAKNMEVFNLVLNGPIKDIDWYIDWGTYEPSIMIDARAFRDGLIYKNYDIICNEWHEAHSWGSWRAHLDIALEYFFPNTASLVEQEGVPQKFILSQNYPNPFNPTTTIKYAIPERSFVELKVFDILGREVTFLVNEEQDAGYYEFNFNAVKLSSGIYFYRIKADDLVQTKKMILLK